MLSEHGLMQCIAATLNRPAQGYVTPLSAARKSLSILNASAAVPEA